MAFEPGNTVNEGRKRSKERPFAEMLRLAIKEANAAGGTKLRDVADALVEKAMSGDVQAIKEIADRLDGKVPQGLVGDDDHDPINVITEIRRTFVDPRPRDGKDV